MFSNFVNGLVRSVFGDDLDKLDPATLKDANKGRVALVTGGTAGLGRVTTLALARTGYDVTFTGRDETAAAAVIEEARQEGYDVTFKKVDFGRLDSVTQFSQEFGRTHRQLDLLVNNAALVVEHHMVTQDGFEVMLQINALAPHHLTRLLLPLLKASPDARMVFVGSDAHWSEQLDLEDLNELKIRTKAAQNEEQRQDLTKPIYLGFGSFQVYGNSKMLNILLAKKLLRNLQAEGFQDLPVYLLHPGEVFTKISRENPSNVLKFFLKVLFRSPEKGARTQIYLSLAPKKDLIPGAYYVSCQPGYCLPRCDDEKLQDEAWKKVEEILAPHPSTLDFEETS